MTSRDSHTNSATRDDAPLVTSLKPTAAQRQRAYRLRRQRAAIEGIGQEATASRVTLLSMLGRDLAALESGTTPAAMVQASRSSAKRILNAIVTRYGIEL
jgi:hypothetical protein